MPFHYFIIISLCFLAGCNSKHTEVNRNSIVKDFRQSDKEIITIDSNTPFSKAVEEKLQYDTCDFKEVIVCINIKNCLPITFQLHCNFGFFKKTGNAHFLIFSSRDNLLIDSRNLVPTDSLQFHINQLLMNDLEETNELKIFFVDFDGLEDLRKTDATFEEILSGYVEFLNTIRKNKNHNLKQLVQKYPLKLFYSKQLFTPEIKIDSTFFQVDTTEIRF